jgi:hypothetical protein
MDLENIINQDLIKIKNILLINLFNKTELKITDNQKDNNSTKVIKGMQISQIQKPIISIKTNKNKHTK